MVGGGVGGAPSMLTLLWPELLLLGSEAAAAAAALGPHD